LVLPGAFDGFVVRERCFFERGKYFLSFISRSFKLAYLLLPEWLRMC
jgi:hypothetical protein